MGRLEPSGSVTEISLIESLAGRGGIQPFDPDASPAFAWPASPPSRFALRWTSRRGLPAVAHAPAGKRERRLVGTGRLELPTSCVSSRRSNQLSYAPMS